MGVILDTQGSLRGQWGGDYDSVWSQRGSVDAPLSAMGPSSGLWGSVEIHGGHLGISGGQWEFSGGQWGSIEINIAQWGLVDVIGAQWESLGLNGNHWDSVESLGISEEH